MSLINTLESRKLVYQFTGKHLNEVLDNAKVCYLGMDATAPAIHAGYMIPILLAKILAEHGVKMIVLLGGGTTRVGDPTGKNASRKMLDEQYIQANQTGLMKAVEKFFPNAIVVNNATWLDKISLMDYLTEIAKHISVNALIHNELFAERLKNQHPLSMMEFTYPLLQGYDYLHLHREYGCNLQIGGSDQWNNMLSGVDLIKRIENKVVHVLSCPLLLTNDGKKMGKSEKGAVWLDADLFSPFDFWQYWRNIADADCEKFFAIFLGRKNTFDINQDKITLANELTAWVHGNQAALEAAAMAKELFEKKNMNNLDLMNFNALSLCEIILQLNWADSKASAKRLIEQGGITIDNQNVKDPFVIIKGTAVLCKGKKVFAKINN